MWAMLVLAMHKTMRANTDKLVFFVLYHRKDPVSKSDIYTYGFISRQMAGIWINCFLGSVSCLFRIKMTVQP